MANGPDPSRAAIDQARGALRFFSEETRETSPLYAHLADALADEEVAYRLLAEAPPDQRRGNLLFAAIHDLLLGGLDHPLADHYPTLGGGRPPDAAAVGAATDLLTEHHDAVLGRLRTRTTQTNEVARCAALWPALRYVAARTDRPLALVELGTSAGLLLHLDRYRYDLDDAPGDLDADLLIASERLGGRPPPGRDPRIARRIGIDLRPLDVRDAGDVRWLRACVWPEHLDRIERLDRAVPIATAHDDVELVSGDLVERLPHVVWGLPDDVLPVVLHSAALAYLDDERIAAIDRTLEGLGAERDLARIALEAPFVEPFPTLEATMPTPRPAVRVAFLLGVTTWTGGARGDVLLARMHEHGRRIEWFTG